MEKDGSWASFVRSSSCYIRYMDMLLLPYNLTTTTLTACLLKPFTYIGDVISGLHVYIILADGACLSYILLPCYQFSMPGKMSVRSSSVSLCKNCGELKQEYGRERKSFGSGIQSVLCWKRVFRLGLFIYSYTTGTNIYTHRNVTN